MVGIGGYGWLGPGRVVEVMPTQLLHADVTQKVIGIFYDVYNELGWGFLESVYGSAMAIALAEEPSLEVQRQPEITVEFRGRVVGTFRADFLVNGVVVLELKSVARLHPAYDAQLTNYLRATAAPVGLLLNFGLIPTFKRIAALPRVVPARPRRGAIPSDP
jgi:GxxExxY protein